MTTPESSEISQINPNTNSGPFDVHHSDSPTTILITPLLTGDNYSSWSRGMTKALRAKAKLGFVDGSIEKPTDPKELELWGRCNDLVSSWLINSVDPPLRDSILYDESAFDIWHNLYDRFHQSNAPKIFQLKRAISCLKQDNSDVSTYFTHLKALQDELNSLIIAEPCTCGHGRSLLDRTNQDRAMEFLQGLNDRFSSIRSQILLIEPFPSILRIHSLIKQEEIQQNLVTPMTIDSNNAALDVGNNGYNQTRFNGSERQRTKRPRPFCDNCKIHGHDVTSCYKLHGYPPNYGQRNRTRNRQDNINLSVSDQTGQGVPPATSFTNEQYQGILALLDRNRQATAAQSNGNSNKDAHINLTGPNNEDGDWAW